MPKKSQINEYSDPCFILMKNRKEKASEKQKIKLWEKLWKKTSLIFCSESSGLGWLFQNRSSEEEFVWLIFKQFGCD
jgi:hypothetical protein